MFYFKDKKLGKQEIKFIYFPDKTSQLDITLKNIKVDEIVWYYQNEAEIAQLIQILYNIKTTKVHIPFLPYGRQDHHKDFNALYSFLNFIMQMYENIEFTSDDVHTNKHNIDQIITNIPPTNFHKKYTELYSPNFIIFPDKGAKERYSIESFNNTPLIIANKIRDLKGNITSFGFETTPELKDGDRIAIVDDICDGGATFINIAKTLKEINENIIIDVVVSHPLLTKGIKNLQLTGINNCYTYIYEHYLYRNCEDFIQFIKC